MMERAAGLVVYRIPKEEGEKPQFLLLKARYSNHHWSPPKGHLKQSRNGALEEDLAAALRETEEETGIGKHLLSVHEDIQDELKYTVWKKKKQRQKVVTYWLARLLEPQLKVVKSREHQDFKWVDFEEACQLLSEFPDLQDLLGKFQQKLENAN